MAMYTSSIVIKSGWSDCGNYFKLLQDIKKKKKKKKKKNPTDDSISFRLTENEHPPNDFQQSFKKYFLRNTVNGGRQDQIGYWLE